MYVCEPKNGRSRLFTVVFTTMSVKVEIDVAAYSPQFHNRLAAKLNSSLCSKFRVMLEKMPVLDKLQF